MNILFTSSLTIMAGATIAPSLPQIQQVFADHPQSEILIKLILTIPALFIALFSPVVGALIDRFGLLLISLVYLGMNVLAMKGSQLHKIIMTNYNSTHKEKS